MKVEMKEIINKGINVTLKTGKSDKVKWKEIFLLIITYLSFNRKIDLNEVRNLSIRLSKGYNYLMESFNRELGISFDILKTIKTYKYILNENLKLILEEIEKLKEYKNGKGSKNHTEEVNGISG